jgi:hypothetical protein
MNITNIDNRMRFKTWLQQENLAGPGGGPEPTADSPEELGKADAKLGVGAYHQGGDNPPLRGSGFPKAFLDPRFNRKAMKKKMKKT